MPLPEPLRRLAWRGYRASEMRLHELRTLTWEATRRCNLACLHCASRCGPGVDTSAELSTAEALALFDSVAADFNPAKVSIAITGGEPLARRDLFTITAHLQQLGLAWAVSTNGTLINAHTIAALIETGCGGVSVSLDGLAPQHEALRGRGTFVRAASAVRALAASPLATTLEVASCVATPLAQGIDEAYAFIATLGISRWRLMPLAPLGQARDNPALRLSPADLRRVLDWLALKRQAPEAGLEVVFDEAGYLGREYDRKVRPGYFFCGAGVTGAVVHADGGVNGCVFLNRSFDQGNVRDKRLSELWRDGFKLFRERRWMKQGLCSGCRDYADCQGGCLLYRESPDSAGPCACMAQMLKL